MQTVQTGEGRKVNPFAVKREDFDRYKARLEMTDRYMFYLYINQATATFRKAESGWNLAQNWHVPYEQAISYLQKAFSFNHSFKNSELDVVRWRLSLYCKTYGHRILEEVKKRNKESFAGQNSEALIRAAGYFAIASRNAKNGQERRHLAECAMKNYAAGLPERIRQASITGNSRSFFDRGIILAAEDAANLLVEHKIEFKGEDAEKVLLLVMELTHIAERMRDSGDQIWHKRCVGAAYELAPDKFRSGVARASATEAATTTSG